MLPTFKNIYLKNIQFTKLVKKRIKKSPRKAEAFPKTKLIMKRTCSPQNEGKHVFYYCFGSSFFLSEHFFEQSDFE